MLREKKFFVALSLFGVASSCLAVTDLFALKPGFEFSIAPLMLQPSATNLNYVIFNQFQPKPSPRWTEQELNPSYEPGVEVGVRYVFEDGSDNDINFTWTYFNSTTSGSTVAPNSDYFLGPDYLIGPSGSTIREAEGSVQFSYNQVNLDFGQYVNFKQVKLRFFAGLTGPYLHEDVQTTFYGGGSFGKFSMLQDVSSTFSGAGPRIGLGGAYKIGASGFGVVGEGGMAAIIGSLSTATNFTGNAEGGAHDNHQFLKDQSTTQVIPEFDAKLGVNYKHALNNGMLVSAALGYQAIVYINAISQYLPGSLLPYDGIPSDFSAGGLYVNTVSHTLSNYTLQGVFFNVGLAV